MCGLLVTEELYRTACSLSDADSQIFPNPKNYFTFNLPNVRTAAKENIGTNKNLREICLNQISTNFCDIP